MTRESDRERRTLRRLADDTRRAQQRLDRETHRTDVTGGATGANGADVAPVDADQNFGTQRAFLEGLK